MTEERAPYKPFGGRKQTKCPACRQDTLKFDFARRTWACLNPKCHWVERRPT